MTENDNIGKRILSILKDKGVKPTPFEVKKDISRGYLKRAADSGTGIGTEIVEKILLEYPDVDSYWLITGKQVSRNTDEKVEKLTGGGKAAGLLDTIKMLEERIEELKQDKRDLLRDKEDLRKRLSDLEEGKAVAR